MLFRSFEEMPYQYNPARGFVSSANQRQLDTTYPYYLGRDYPPFRGWYLNKQLDNRQMISVQDMMSLQTSNYNAFASMAMPLFVKYVLSGKLTSDGRRYYDELKRWNGSSDATSTSATVFELAWQSLYDTIYNDEFQHAPEITMKPFRSTLAEALLRDSAYKFVDNEIGRAHV